MDVLGAIAQERAIVAAQLEAIGEERRDLDDRQQRLEAHLVELEAAERTLRRLNPAARQARPLSGSIKDLVLATLRDAHPRGMDRRAVVARIRRQHGVSVKPDTVTTSLCEWARAGRTRRVGKIWFALSGAGDMLDEA